MAVDAFGNVLPPVPGAGVIIDSAGLRWPIRSVLNLPGGTVTDDPVGGQSKVTITAGGATAAGTAMITAATAVAQAALLGSTIPTIGTAIPDADTTVSLSTGAHFVMATRTAARVITLGVTGTPVTGETIIVDVIGTGAFTVTIKDDAATTLFTVAASQKMTVLASYDGTHFANVRAMRIQ